MVKRIKRLSQAEIDNQLQDARMEAAASALKRADERNRRQADRTLLRNFCDEAASIPLPPEAVLIAAIASPPGKMSWGNISVGAIKEVAAAIRRQVVDL